MTINKEANVAVLCGGISNEREVSLRSGKNCFDALIRLGYKNTILVDIKSINDLYELKTKKTDVAFLVTHGKYGEDGAIQGVLEWLKIPYTGSSITASAIAMDKWLTKQIASSLNIKTPKGSLINKSNNDLEEIWTKLSSKSGSLFLKPNNEGSSVSTFKIKSLNDFKEKLSSINLSKGDFLAEECIEGKEVTSSIIETNGKLKVLPILELRPKKEFYDYEAKYTKGMTDFILPAEISEILKKEIEDSSIKIFTGIGCSSFGRVDFIIQGNTPYLLEVNSLAGMTDTSDLPAQAKYAGIGYDEVVELVLQGAKLYLS